MSLCDTCHSPGNCCKRIFLSGEGFGIKNMLASDALRALVYHAHVEKQETGWEFPFIISGRNDDGHIIYRCPKLGDDGRCTIYDKRPRLCRNYEPASDRLCVYYQPPATEST